VIIAAPEAAADDFIKQAIKAARLNARLVNDISAL
jgi:hypothetical protein